MHAMVQIGNDSGNNVHGWVKAIAGVKRISLERAEFVAMVQRRQTTTHVPSREAAKRKP
jgi:hypothetical protein